MLIAVAVLASLALFGWLTYRAIRRKTVKASTISRALAYLAGIYTFAYFLSMEIPQLFKIVVSILLGMVFIILAAYIQKSRQPDKS